MFVWLLKTNAIIRQGKDTENGPNFIKDQVFSSFKTQIHAFRFVTCTHGVTLPFHNSPKVIYWIEIWWLCRPFEYHEVIVMFKKKLWDDLSFDTWFQYPTEAAIRWCCNHKGTVSVTMMPKHHQQPERHTHAHTHYLKTLNFTSILSDLFHRATWKHILQNTIEVKIHTAHQQYSICKTTAITKNHPKQNPHLTVSQSLPLYETVSDWHHHWCSC